MKAPRPADSSDARDASASPASEDENQQPTDAATESEAHRSTEAQWRVQTALRAVYRAAAAEEVAASRKDRQPETTPDTPTASTSWGTAAASETPADAGSAADSGAPRPGRRNRKILAGAVIGGSLLVAIPLLVFGTGGDNHRPPKDSALSDTALEDGLNATGPDADVTAGPNGATSVASLSAHPKRSDPPHPGSTSGHSDTPTSPQSTSSKGSTTPKKPTSSETSGNGPAAVPGITVWSHASRRCIDVPDPGSDGTQLQIWDCNGSAAQHWQFMSDGTVRALGKCMKVAGGSTSDGAAIQLATCNGSPAQQFRLNAAHDLVNQQADKCVDVRDMETGNGTRLQLWQCNGHDNQKWN